MDRHLMGFCLGGASALLWPFIPDWPWALLPLAGLLLSLWRGPRPLLVGLCLGLLWLQLSLHFGLAWLEMLPAQQRVSLVGTLERWERGDERFSRWWVRAGKLDGEALWPAPLVQLNLYRPLPPPAVGSRVSLTARLKPAHGLGNAAGWDGRRTLLGKGVTATGTLDTVVVLASRPAGLRERWLTRADALWHPLAQAPLLRALTFGEQGEISRRQWELFRGGGLTHVIAISGQHIAIVALLGWWLGRLWGERPAIILSSLLALIYAYLAGLGVSVERALLMVLVWGGLRWWRRAWPPWRVWLWAFALLLLWDPLSLCSAGFWLSFVAVALLMVAGLLWQRPSLWRLQLWMLLGLLPLQVTLFGGVAPLAFATNLLLLPLFGLVIIPAALIGVLLIPLGAPLAYPLLWLSNEALVGVIWLLEWLAGQLSLWWPLGREWGLVAGIGLIALTALPLAGGRWLLLPALTLCLLVVGWPRDGLRVSVLDVGQGLSVVISRGGRALVYDTGDSYPGGYSMADAALLPHLHERGITRVDTLVISHKDRDHSGGRRRLLRQMAVGREISSYPFAGSTEPCQAGQQWRWQEVQVRVLWPESGHRADNSRNNGSCVLRLDGKGWSLLLPGDIEKEAEAALVARWGSALRSDLLVVPHHGSRTSSTPAFVAAVAPRFVVYGAGLYNRWRFPRAEVVARYQGLGAHQWVTGLHGEVVMEVGPEGPEVSAERAHGPWYRRHGAWWKPALWLE
ncbi:DNA internalization-related competence protein ComEC/Rec2 [Aeromonas diversa]|uniref:DNA internalization-related competence protein ComEC/Rec2 n=1 Tax=Aeromonas diversa TaxID=502790 RepID=UPI0039A3A904